MSEIYHLLLTQPKIFNSTSPRFCLVDVSQKRFSILSLSLSRRSEENNHSILSLSFFPSFFRDSNGSHKGSKEKGGRGFFPRTTFLFRPLESLTSTEKIVIPPPFLLIRYLFRNRRILEFRTKSCSIERASASSHIEEQS